MPGRCTLVCLFAKRQRAWSVPPRPEATPVFGALTRARVYWQDTLVSHANRYTPWRVLVTARAYYIDKQPLPPGLHASGTPDRQ